MSTPAVDPIEGAVRTTKSWIRFLDEMDLSSCVDYLRHARAVASAADAVQELNDARSALYGFSEYVELLEAARAAACRAQQHLTETARSEAVLASAIAALPPASPEKTDMVLFTLHHQPSSTALQYAVLGAVVAEGSGSRLVLGPRWLHEALDADLHLMAGAVSPAYAAPVDAVPLRLVAALWVPAPGSPLSSLADTLAAAVAVA